MDLDHWQVHLDEHFRRLSEERSEPNSSATLFALEHGLSLDQVQDLRSAIRGHIAAKPPSNEHWLAWVVYAAESGYAYSGDEYWQTFEDDAPGWAEYDSRNWLRSRFQRFAASFGGARPTGPWANHFTIISWPITHAILPKDLQRHLARELFEIRHAIRPEHLHDPTALGRLIHARSRATSSRFRQLTQEAVLIGQISAALLLHGSQDDASRILPATLDRIAADLVAEQRAREWLRQAQAATAARLKQSRLTPVRRQSSALWPTTTEDARDEMASLALEPHLLVLAGEPAWAVYLEIPNLSPLSSRFPQLDDILRNSRCLVQGAAGGRPMAGGRVLSGSRHIRIESWPQEDEVLIQFEQSSPELDYLLRTDCLLRSGPTWLFEHQMSGFGREIKSRKVKPGGRYVVVSTDSLPVDGEWLKPLQLEAAGVEAALLSVPDFVGSDFVQAAKAMGLTVSADIEMWPAGLAPASWDGIGRGEWRTTDKPHLGVRANIETERLTIIIESADPVALTLPGSAVREPQFLELPSLEVGTYKLRVTATGNRPGQEVELGSFEVVMRDPRPWASANDESSPLVVIPDPRAPTLEQLWDGSAAFHVHAPPSRLIECRLSLYESLAEKAFLETRLPPFTPSVTPGQSSVSLSAHLGQLRDSASAFDRASRCHLEFRAGDLGAFQLECERASTPVRWVARRVGRDGYHLRVLDDRGSETELALRHFSFDTPEQGQALYALAYFAPDGAHAADGLYIAEWDDQWQAVIVSQGHSLRDLGADPVLHYGTRSKGRVREILSRIEVWRRADLRGDLSALTRRNSVVKALLGGLVDAVGSPGWGNAEEALIRFGDSKAVERLERAVVSSNSDDLYRLLSEACRKYDGNSRQIRRVCIAWLTSVFGRRSARPDAPQPPQWIAEFTLRLASAPCSIRGWAGPDFDFGLDVLFGRPELLRAARFAVLIADRELTPQPLNPAVLYTGWGWE